MSSVLRYLLAALMVAAGVLHFVRPRGFTRIVPAWLPAPLLLVYLSGVFEVLGGVGLLAPWPEVRRAAAWGLAALFVAVFPANVNMAVNHIGFSRTTPAWLLWARLPLQPLLVWWAVTLARG